MTENVTFVSREHARFGAAGMVVLFMMEVWSAYNCRDSASYSSATHVQIGPFQASKRDVSVKASDQSRARGM